MVAPVLTRSSTGSTGYMKTLSASAVNWNGGKETGTDLSSVIDFSHFEWLAQNAEDSDINGYKVIVKTSGGTFDTSDFRGSDGQGEDNGRTVVIFNTADEVTLTKTNWGRQFGPSVNAPFSVVKLDGDTGFMHGFVVAQEFDSNVEGDPSKLQLHGDTYVGPITCKTGPSPTPGPTPSPVEELVTLAPITPIPTPEPTPGPTPLCVEVEALDDSICEGGVALVTLLAGPTPPAVMMEVVNFEASGVVPMVTFKLSNKFQGSVDSFFVQYHEQVYHMAYDLECQQHPGTADCGDEVTLVTALCQRGSVHRTPFTLVQIWARQSSQHWRAECV
jgi:hypothetical protein